MASVGGVMTKAFWVAVLLGGLSVFGATNEYYTKPEVKKIVDEVIAAYGGEEKLKGVERAKVTMEIKEGPATFVGTLYQASGKARMDMEIPGRMKAVNIFDGKTFVYLLNGKPAPAPPNAKDTLEYGVKEGVFQASMLHTFLSKEHELVYRGKKEYDGKEYDLIETTDTRPWKKEHYIDPQTRREMVTVTRHDKGGYTHVAEAFDEFEGVLYQKRVSVKGVDGSTRGSMRVLGVSKDFGDEVFASPK
jgi:hypothetical protein